MLVIVLVFCFVLVLFAEGRVGNVGGWRRLTFPRCAFLLLGGKKALSVKVELTTEFLEERIYLLYEAVRSHSKYHVHSLQALRSRSKPITGTSTSSQSPVVYFHTLQPLSSLELIPSHLLLPPRTFTSSVLHLHPLDLSCPARLLYPT